MSADNSDSSQFTRKLLLAIAFGIVVITALVWGLNTKMAQLSRTDEDIVALVEDAFLNLSPEKIQVRMADGTVSKGTLVEGGIKEGSVVGDIVLQLESGEVVELSPTDEVYSSEEVNTIISEVERDYSGQVTAVYLSLDDYYSKTEVDVRIDSAIDSIPTEIPDGSVVTVKLADEAVTELKLGTDSVTVDKIADGSVTSDKVADGSIVTAKLVDGVITSSKLSSGVVLTEHLNNLSVTEVKISDGAVTSTKILDGTISDSDIAIDAAITWSKISKVDSSLADLEEAAASDVDISDTGGYFSGTTVEDVLQEIAGGSFFDSEYLRLDALNDPVTGQLVIQPSSDEVAIIVKGSVGQTANLMEWQDSSGNILGKIESTGQLRIIQGDAADFGTFSNGSISLYREDDLNSNISITGYRDAQPGNSITFLRGRKLGTEGSISVSDDIGEIDFIADIGSSNQYGARLVGKHQAAYNGRSLTRLDLSTIKSDGLALTPALTAYWDQQTGFGAKAGLTLSSINPLGATVAIGTNVSTETGLVIQGASSQSANLTEWKNSGGTVLARISSGGNLYANLGTNSTNFFVGGGGNSTNTGQANVAVGSTALISITDANYNTAIGDSAGQQLTSGGSNLAVGGNALGYTQTASGNVAIGSSAIQGYGVSLATQIPINIVAIGAGAVGNFTGAPQEHVFIGRQAGYKSTNNYYCVGIGNQSFFNITTGSNNVGIGYQAGYQTTTGGGNTFIGYKAGYNETGNNKLYIANSDTTTPLIYGQFSGTGAGLTIYSQATDGVALTVKGIALQSSNLTEWQNSSGTLLVSVDSSGKISTTAGLDLNTTGAKPTCDSSNRGLFWFTESGAGVQDTLEICAKDAGDAYSWRTLY